MCFVCVSAATLAKKDEDFSLVVFTCVTVARGWSLVLQLRFLGFIPRVIFDVVDMEVIKYLIVISSSKYNNKIFNKNH